MSTTPQPIIDDIRAASRDLVREFGFMGKTLAGTDLSPSAVHAIVEIGKAGALTATDLGELLLLEKSTVSRLVQSLIERRLIAAKAASADARRKDLRLTASGSRMLRAITDYAEKQVSTALARLPAEAVPLVRFGLRSYADALAGERHATRTPDAVRIGHGYRSGIVGRVVEMQTGFYSGHDGFGAPFEARIATELAAFVARPPSERNRIWHADLAGQIVGAVTIDGEDLGDNIAHLRWFIIDPSVRGTGLGERLLSAAMAFCDERGFKETRLWTLKGLEAAKRLYERHGFELTGEYLGDQWGAKVTEQTFSRRAPAKRRR